MKRNTGLKTYKPLQRKSVLKAKTPLKSHSVLKSNSSLKSSGMLKKSPLKKQNDEARKKWCEVRKQALERDCNKCIVCGKKATQVHHIHLRSKRRDLLYSLNNLVSLCDLHHFHRGMEKYKEQTELIAKAKGLSVEELLQEAEQKEGE